MHGATPKHSTPDQGVTTVKVKPLGSPAGTAYDCVTVEAKSLLTSSPLRKADTTPAVGRPYWSTMVTVSWPSAAGPGPP